MRLARASADVASLLAAGLLVVAAGSPAADAMDIEPLLKPLELRSYRPGTRPPEFSGSTADAQRLSLADLRGKVVIVNFWATWCTECRHEMPALERLHRALAGRGLAVVGINAREDRATVVRYAQELPLSFPLMLDPGGQINAHYGVVGLPATFVIGRDGRAVALAIGSRDWASRPARALIDALLAEPMLAIPR